MPITNFPDLKKHNIMMTLNRKQSECDNHDAGIVNSAFTRSPLHAITFLIVYAGLTAEQRQATLTNLALPIAKADIDQLINDIDWSAILVPSSTQPTLAFEFNVGIASESAFFDAVALHCPALHHALKDKQSIVKIGQADQVSFITTFSQNEIWSKPFHRGQDSFFWDVPKFKLSPALITHISALAPGKTQHTGAFAITKGTGSLVNTIKLEIKAPYGSNEYSVDSDLEVNNGIYNAFQGLTHFYGLEHVDGVIVKLQSKAQFSDKGASASQTQVVTCFTESMSSRVVVDKPTVVTVNDLHVLFNGMDVVAGFASSIQRAKRFDGNMYIDLPTQSNGQTGVTLFAQLPMPSDAFSLIHGEAQQAALAPQRYGLFSSITSQTDQQHDCSIPCNLL